jgi:hypothetical protein
MRFESIASLKNYRFIYSIDLNSRSLRIIIDSYINLSKGLNTDQVYKF